MTVARCLAGIGPRYTSAGPRNSLDRLLLDRGAPADESGGTIKPVTEPPPPSVGGYSIPDIRRCEPEGGRDPHAPLCEDASHGRLTRGWAVLLVLRHCMYSPGGVPWPVLLGWRGRERLTTAVVLPRLSAPPPARTRRGGPSVYVLYSASSAPWAAFRRGATAGRPPPDTLVDHGDAPFSPPPHPRPSLSARYSPRRTPRAGVPGRPPFFTPRPAGRPIKKWHLYTGARAAHLPSQLGRSFPPSPSTPRRLSPPAASSSHPLHSRRTTPPPSPPQPCVRGRWWSPWRWLRPQPPPLPRRPSPPPPRRRQQQRQRRRGRPSTPLPAPSPPRPCRHRRPSASPPCASRNQTYTG